MACSRASLALPLYSKDTQLPPKNYRYLQNGNVLAARSFIKHFVSSFTSKYPSFTSSGSSSLPIGSGDEILVTSDSVLNFAQVAVRLCQRAQGDKNKLMRESWVRFCGTYQSRGGVFGTREIRKVRWRLSNTFRCLVNPSRLGSDRDRRIVLRSASAKGTTSEPTG